MKRLMKSLGMLGVRSSVFVISQSPIHWRGLRCGTRNLDHYDIIVAMTLLDIYR